MTDIPSIVPGWVLRSKVGDKIVCVDVDGLNIYHNCLLPTVGVIYTIREILVKDSCYKGQWVYTPSFLLMEIKNDVHRWSLKDGSVEFWERHFQWSRFKPLTQKLTDISVFTSMLKGSESHLEVVKA